MKHQQLRALTLLTVCFLALLCSVSLQCTPPELPPKLPPVVEETSATCPACKANGYGTGSLEDPARRTKSGKVVR